MADGAGPGDSLRALRYERGSLQVVEQRALPHEKTMVEVAGVQDAWKVIRDMSVRGAPLIAIVASLGLAVEITKRRSSDGAELAEFILKSTAHLRTSRPTAVNLFNAMDEIDALVDCHRSASAADLGGAIVQYAEKLREDDYAKCKAMGKVGAEAVLRPLGDEQKASILTICNTGSLATGGYGTALGVVRAVFGRERLEQVYVMETRPYNQVLAPAWKASYSSCLSHTALLR